MNSAALHCKTRLTNMTKGCATRTARRTAARNGSRFDPAIADLKGRETVLVVDNLGLMRKAIAEVLRRFGYRVLEASSIMEAQRLAHSRRKIDLLLTDFSTSELCGLELARWFQSRFPDTKVVIATDSLWELLCHTGDQERFGVLVKPFSDLELGA